MQQTNANTETFDRQLQASAGLKLFFGIADLWQLSTEEQMTLLGNMKKSRFFDLKKNPGAANLSDDELDRLSFIANIHSSLAIMFNEENQRRFLKTPQDENGDLAGRAPIDIMLSGIRGLLDMNDYFSSLRGGGFA
jgi:hypothetical protein